MNTLKIPNATKPSRGLGQTSLRQVIGYQIAQASVAANALFETGVTQPLGIRRLEYSMLMLIRENPACSPVQLSRALGVARPQVSLLVDRLEARGLLTREQNLKDRRGRHLKVSEAGSALAEDATRRLIEAEHQAFSRLSPGEHLMLAELLHKLA